MNDDEWRELFGIIQTVTQGDYVTWRQILLSGLPARFRAMLQVSPVPAAQVRLDLKSLRDIPLIADGVVPIERYLRELIENFEVTYPAEVVRLKDMLAKIRADASGAPPVGPLTQEEVQEAIVHQDDMLPISFIHNAAEAAKAVARIVVPRIINGKPVRTSLGDPIVNFGTCWLVAPGLVLTNHHVIQARPAGTPAAKAEDIIQQVENARIFFDFDDDEAEPTDGFGAELVVCDKDLDFALLRVDIKRAWLEIDMEVPAAPDGHQAPALNIIQHPRGRAKRVAIRNNLVSSVSDVEMRYFTDTEGGSSGSPVFNDQWKAVALHRAHRFATGVQFQGKDSAYVNVGTRLSAIHTYLVKHLTEGSIPELGI